jgi:hypothetical protein
MSACAAGSPRGHRFPITTQRNGRMGVWMCWSSGMPKINHDLTAYLLICIVGASIEPEFLRSNHPFERTGVVHLVGDDRLSGSWGPFGAGPRSSVLGGHRSPSEPVAPLRVGAVGDAHPIRRTGMKGRAEAIAGGYFLLDMYMPVGWYSRVLCRIRGPIVGFRPILSG